MLTIKERFKEGELEKPYAATEMGLIYVNPEGPEESQIQLHLPKKSGLPLPG